MKKILALDLGSTSIGYAVVNSDDDRVYSLLDYGVSMIDMQESGDKSKKSAHAKARATSKLYNKRKSRLKKLLNIFITSKLATKDELLNSKNNANKWYLRCEKAYNEPLAIDELFSVLYMMAKHRGYKSLDNDLLLCELLESLGIKEEEKETNDRDEKGKIKQALKYTKGLLTNKDYKSVAQAIYKNNTDTKSYHNHNNEYKYMITRENIQNEVKSILQAQRSFGAIKCGEEFDNAIITIITYQDPSKNDTNNLSKCTYYKDYEVGHSYSYLADIFKYHKAVNNITINNQNISQEQKQKLYKWLMDKINKSTNIAEIRYKDVRDVLELTDDQKIFGKNDTIEGKKNNDKDDKKSTAKHNTIIKFDFFAKLKDIKSDHIKEIGDRYEIHKEIAIAMQENKQPLATYEALVKIWDTYNLSNKQDTIIALIKNKQGKPLNISYQAMINFLPYLADGLSEDEIKQKLNLSRVEDYSSHQKGIKYLSVAQYETEDNQKINNHTVKYTVSAVLRVIKHLHTKYGVFDTIKVETTKDLSLSDEAKKDIENANKKVEEEYKRVKANQQYQEVAKKYNKDVSRYATKILLWEEQQWQDLYTGEYITLDDIFGDLVQIDHIVPRSIGGLDVKHNRVLTHTSSNQNKTNRLPMDYVVDKVSYISRVEKLKLNYKKRKNLLATNLDEIYKDKFESKTLRATSYIEALTANIIKRYYPFCTNTNQSVQHMSGKITANIRKLLEINTKDRTANIHHAIDAILIAITNKSWIQKLSTHHRENYQNGFNSIDVTHEELVKKLKPLIEGATPKDIISKIEEEYFAYPQSSIFYKDVFGKTKVVYFWVSKKPESSSIHKETVYSKKNKTRVDLQQEFDDMKITLKTKAEDFAKLYDQKIKKQLYVYKYNPNDKLIQDIDKKANTIIQVLTKYNSIDTQDKEAMEIANKELKQARDTPIIGQNGNKINKVQMYINVSGIDVRGGVCGRAKSFIGIDIAKEKNKLKYTRIDMENKSNILGKTNNMQIFKNDILFFVFKDKYAGGRIVSFSDEKLMASFSNPKYPSNIKSQPEDFLTMFKGKPNSHKPYTIGKATGIIKLNIDVLGNIKSYNIIGKVDSSIYEDIKAIIKDK